MDYDKALRLPGQSTVGGLVPSPTLNLVAGDICERIEDHLDENVIVLVIGCGDGGAGINSFTKPFRERHVFGADLRRTHFVDFLADGRNLPFDDECIDAVICQAVLEHVDRDGRVIEELTRILRPGGLLYVDVPLLQGYHALPTDYRRYTERGITNALDGLQKIDSGASVGPTSSMIWLFCEYFGYLLSFGSLRLRKTLSIAARFSIFWLKHLDRVIVPIYGDDERVLTIPSAVYWFGRKPEGR